MATMTLRSIILYVLSFILGGATTYAVVALTDSEEPCSVIVDDDELVFSVPASEAIEYRNYYREWVTSGGGPGEIQIMAYNVNANLLEAIQRHRGSSIATDYVRTYFAFLTPATSSSPPPVYMVVYPLNESCTEMPVTGEVYMAKMSPEFSMPCPDFCD